MTTYAPTLGTILFFVIGYALLLFALILCILLIVKGKAK